MDTKEAIGMLPSLIFSTLINDALEKMEAQTNLVMKI